MSIAGFSGMEEREVLIDGFSKKYAMTGLHEGFVNRLSGT